MNFAREGLMFIVGSALIAAAVILVAVTMRSWPLWVLGFLLLVIAIWVASFFRDPERPGPRGDGIVIAPADGKVVLINEVDEPAFIGGRALRVSIFMNVFNVHVNRYPVSGVVEYVQANPGKFLNAIAPEASLENEQTSVGIVSGRHKILVRQIAGLIARRIVTYSRTGDQVRQADRMGLIRFGSRVDVFLPLQAKLKVKVGDISFAGVTVLGELPMKQPRLRERPGVRRAVVFLPNGFTLTNLFCGIYAIVLSARGDFDTAALFVVIGGFADVLDGRVARATGTGSRFGEELDSLVDAISFGLAPAMIMFFAVLNTQNWQWLLVFIFTSCAVMRLARFNVEQAGRKKTYFHGLPSPMAGLTLATYYWFSQTDLYRQSVIWFTDAKTIADLPWPRIMAFLMAILAALMISDVPYPAFPSVGYKNTRQRVGTLVIIASAAGLVLLKKEFIFPALIAYVLFGPIQYTVLGLAGRSRSPDEIFWDDDGNGGSSPAELPPRRPAPSSSGGDVIHSDDGGVDRADERDRAQRRRKRRRGRGSRPGPPFPPPSSPPNPPAPPRDSDS